MDTSNTLPVDPAVSGSARDFDLDESGFSEDSLNEPLKCSRAQLPCQIPVQDDLPGLLFEILGLLRRCLGFSLVDLLPRKFANSLDDLCGIDARNVVSLLRK